MNDRAKHPDNQGLLDFVRNEVELLKNIPNTTKWRARNMQTVAKSISKHHLELKNSKECQSLVGVGVSTAHMLDRYLREHKSDVVSPLLEMETQEFKWEYWMRNRSKSQLIEEMKRNPFWSNEMVDSLTCKEMAIELANFHKTAVNGLVTKSRVPNKGSLPYWNRLKKSKLREILDMENIPYGEHLLKTDLCKILSQVHTIDAGKYSDSLVGIFEEPTQEIAQPDLLFIPMPEESLTPIQERSLPSRSFIYSPVPASSLTPFYCPATEYASNNASWELVLLIDNREKMNNNEKTEVFQGKLLQAGVPVEVCALPLGDMLWIFRQKDDDCTLVNPVEYASDFIIERKQVADLAGSIRDGRYDEQKLRLHLCGLKRVIYLVEGSPSSQSVLPPAALETAMTETQIRNGFSVQVCSNVDGSIDFLRRMHFLIKSFTTHASPGKWEGSFESWRLLSKFKQTNGKRKLSTVEEVFGAQLKQIKGCSASRAAALLKKYPSPASLHTLYHCELENKSEVQKRLFFQNFKPEGQVNSFGPVLSSKIYDCFNSE